MKTLLFIPVLMLTASNIYAQIKTEQETVMQSVILLYDSTQNCLKKSELEQYIGQTFYLPRTTMEKEKGFRCFKKDIKGKVYKPVDRTYFSKTKYDAVAGKYFEVIGIERKTRAYIDDIYIHLREKDSGEELYFDFGKDAFPFIIQGYYEKKRKELIGRVFYLYPNKKTCVDYYIEEGFTYQEKIKFDDGSSLILGELLFAEDNAGRFAYDKLKNDREIEKRYGKLRLGINRDTCEIICGPPLERNVSEGEWGKHEQWVYDDKYVYLENGRVTSIQYNKK